MVLSIEEERREIELLKECVFGIPAPEEGEELNEIQRTKIKRLLDKYGKIYGVNINLYEGYKEKVIFEIDKNTKLYSYLCDAVITEAKEEDIKKLEKAILKWNESGRREDLDEVFKILEELKAIFTNWW